MGYSRKLWMRVGGGTLAKLQQQTTIATTANPDRLSFSVEKAATEVCRSRLEQVLRAGAIRLLIDALEREIADFIQEHREVRDSEGRQAVVRNGHTRGRRGFPGTGNLRLNIHPFLTNSTILPGWGQASFGTRRRARVSRDRQSSAKHSSIPHEFNYPARMGTGFVWDYLHFQN
jgi:hypothetical protein